MFYSLNLRNATLVIVLFVIVCTEACQDGKRESLDLLSLDTDIVTSLRVTIFGVFSPADTLQEVMLEDSRSNAMDMFGRHSMHIEGMIKDKDTNYDLSYQRKVVVEDPFLMPNMLPLLSAIKSEQLREPQAMQLIDEFAAIAGFTRIIQWYSAKRLAVIEENKYKIELKLVDTEFAPIETVIIDSTTVPGKFNITYPIDGQSIYSEENFQILWEKSQGAAGYYFAVSSPDNPRKRFETSIRNNNFSIPSFFKDKGEYQVNIAAVDQNYFAFLNQILQNQRINRTHFFDYGDMNLSALVVFGSKVEKQVKFFRR